MCAIVTSLLASTSLKILLLTPPATASIWGRKNSEHQHYDNEMYSQSHRKYWLENKKSLRIEYEGCRWSFMQDGGEGCREDESEDGTVYWYQMANCRRANVVYHLYGSENDHIKCNKGHYLDTFVTTSGLEEFAYLLSQYDTSPPISYTDVYELPQCEEDGKGYYRAIGCGSDGNFKIERFSDKYCLAYSSTIDDLSDINGKLRQMSCYDCNVTSALDGDNYGKNDDKRQYKNGLCDFVMSDSASCFTLDAEICSSPFPSLVKNFQRFGIYYDIDQGTRRTKYAFGIAMIGCSAILFLGTFMMNRRIRLSVIDLQKKEKNKKRRDKLFENANIRVADSS